MICCKMGKVRCGQDARHWTWHHATTFILTFFGYACLHACRKAYSNVKDNMAKDFTPQNVTDSLYPYDVWNKEHMFESVDDADVFLGELDALFLLAYAIGLFISGSIGDRVNLRYMLTFGMCGSAVMTFLFGYVSKIAHIENKFYFRCTYFVNGLLQSTGWPGMVAVMGNWFSNSSGGLVYGIWSANSSVGNVIGAFLVAAVLDYGYEYGILVNSILLFCCGILFFFCLLPHPKMVGLPSPVEQSITEQNISKSDERAPFLDPSSDSDFVSTSHVCEADTLVKVKEPKAIGFFAALLIPGVIPYSLSYAFIKLVNYAFFFWLPVYLQQGLHWDDSLSDQLSSLYDGGGIFGGIIVGIITDLMGFRSPIVGVTLALSIPCLYVYSVFGSTYTVNALLMFLVGFMTGGPANTISTAITADLGKHEKIRGSAEALATVTGIIDGTGSAGAAIGMYLVPVINRKAGWHVVFYFLMIATAGSLLCIVQMLWNECKELYKRAKFSQAI